MARHRGMVEPTLQTPPATPSRILYWEWVQTALLSANLAWTTLCLGGYRADTLVVTAVLSGTLLAVHFAGRALWPVAEVGPLHPVAWAPLPFVAYAAASAAWITPVPWLGWRDGLGWANLAAIFWVITNGIRSRRPRAALFFTLCGLGAVAVFLAGHQRFVQPDWLMLGRRQVEQFIGRSSGPFGIPNSLAGFLLLLVPATAGLAFRRGATAGERIGWGWLTVVFLLGIFLTFSRGAWISLAVALMIWPLIAPRGHWRRRLAWFLAVIVLLAAITTAVWQTSATARQRWQTLVEQSGELSRPILWRGAWGLLREQPITGTGAGSFNVGFERFRPAGFIDEPGWAHNEYLNTLSDYGVVGALLIGFAVVVIVGGGGREPEVTARKRRSWIESSTFATALAVGLIAFALQLVVEFHLKLPALAMAFAVGAGLWVRPRANPNIPPHGFRARCIWGLCAVATLMGLFPIVRMLRAEALHARAAAVLAGELGANPEIRLATAERDLKRAVALNPRNGSAWSELAYLFERRAAASAHSIMESAREMEHAARRALDASVIVPEFWLRLGVALDLQGRTREAEPCFQRASELAPQHIRVLHYQRYHQGLNR